LEAVASTLARVPRAKVAQKGHVRARPLSRHVLVRCSTPLLPAKGLRASATFTLFKALAENSADTFQRAVVEITALPVVPVCPAPLPDLTSADSTDKARLPSQPSGRVQRVQKCRVQRVQKETPSIQSSNPSKSSGPPSPPQIHPVVHCATGSDMLRVQLVQKEARRPGPPAPPWSARSSIRRPSTRRTAGHSRAPRPDPTMLRPWFLWQRRLHCSKPLPKTARIHFNARWWRSPLCRWSQFAQRRCLT